MQNKTMKTGLKIIFWLSILAIFIFAGLPVIINTTPLEFTDSSMQDSLEEVRFFGLPAAILLTLTGTIKRKDDRSKRLIKSGITFSIALFTLFILFATALSGMCRWVNNKTVFEKINDSNTKIVIRDFGCGATDSGSPVVKLFKIRKLTPFFIWVTRTDTVNLDPRVWKRLPINDE